MLLLYEIEDWVDCHSIHKMALVALWIESFCRAEGTKGRGGSKILADQLSLFQPVGADYAQNIITHPPGIPTVLFCALCRDCNARFKSGRSWNNLILIRITWVTFVQLPIQFSAFIYTPIRNNLFIFQNKTAVNLRSFCKFTKKILLKWQQSMQWMSLSGPAL